MRNLKLVLVAAALMGVAAPSFAQGGGGGGGRGGQGGGRMIAQLMTGITLSAEQQVKADSIAKKYADLRTALMADQNMDQDARRTKMRENSTKQIEELKAILTDDQKKVFEKNQADAAAARPPQER